MENRVKQVCHLTKSLVIELNTFKSVFLEALEVRKTYKKDFEMYF